MTHGRTSVHLAQQRVDPRGLPPSTSDDQENIYWNTHTYERRAGCPRAAWLRRADCGRAERPEKVKSGQRERHGPHLAEQAQRRARETDLCPRCFRQTTPGSHVQQAAPPPAAQGRRQAVRRRAQRCRSCRGQWAVGSGTALLVDGGSARHRLAQVVRAARARARRAQARRCACTRRGSEGSR